MQRNTKIILGIVGGFAVLAIAIAAIGAWFIYSNMDGWTAKAKSVADEGRAAGRSLREPACVDAALKRANEDYSIAGAIGARVWLDACLETSIVDAEFCKSVPTDDITDLIAWQFRVCADAGMTGDENCTRIIREVPSYCVGPVRAAKLSP